MQRLFEEDMSQFKKVVPQVYDNIIAADILQTNSAQSKAVLDVANSTNPERGKEGSSKFDSVEDFYDEHPLEVTKHEPVIANVAKLKRLPSNIAIASQIPLNLTALEDIKGGAQESVNRARAINNLQTRRRFKIIGFCLIAVCIITAVVVSFVWYATSSESGGTLDNCAIGYYCLRETFVFPCPGGRFGNSTGLTTSDCSGVCTAGYYCPLASITPTANLCPAGSYCPEGSAEPILCPAGSFGNETGLSHSSCSGSCSAGYYCPQGSTSAKEIICPLGSYCPDGTRYGTEFICPLGTYNDEPGLAAISDCPICEAEPGAGYVCARGSSQSPSEDVILCPEGHYCTGIGLPIECPSGTYGNVEGLSTSACSGNCPSGYWCPDGTVTATSQLCPAGYYCPSGVQNYSDNLCWEGYYCAEGTQTPYTLCIQGRYCPAGSSDGTYCPAGTYGISEGLIYPNCTGLCPASYYCPAGSVARFTHLCPSGSYCPEGTGAGEEFKCPAGNWSSLTGLSELSQCSCTDPSGECSYNGLCYAGYYCPEGSTSGTGEICPANFYCPRGSSAPILCEELGYYCRSRAQSPYAYTNGARFTILETLSAKARRWAADYPAAAQQYLYQNYTLEQGFMIESSKSTYDGSLYEDERYYPVRGLSELNVNFTTYGFFNASVFICSVLNGTEDPLPLAEVGNIQMDAARNSSDTYTHSFKVHWDIPREFVDGEMVVCLRMPQGDDPFALVVSDIFEIMAPDVVKPLRYVATICIGSLFVLILVATIPCFLLHADRSRDREIHALIKSPAPNSVRLLSRLFRVIEPAQFMAVIFWNPAIKQADTAADALAFWWNHLLGLYFLPVMGFIVACLVAGGVIIFAVSTDVVLRLLKLERRRLEMTCVARLLAFEGLYIPILMTLLSPFDCAYTNPKADDAYFEFVDQVRMRYFLATHLECWHNPMHILFSLGAVILAPCFYYMALKNAIQDDFVDVLHVNMVCRYRVLSIIVKTIICFGAVLTNAGQTVTEALALTLCSTTLSMEIFLEVRHMQPTLGRAARTNDLLAGSYLAVAYLSLAGLFISLIHEAKNIEERTSWPMVFAYCFLPLSFLLGVRLNYKFSRAQVEANTFEKLTSATSASVRNRALEKTIEFLLSVYTYENAKGEKLQNFVKHLGTLVESEPLARNAVASLVSSNADPSRKTFGVDVASVSSAAFLGSGFLPLYGEPIEMLSMMLLPIHSWDLSGIKFEDSVILRIGQMLPKMHNLHSFELGKPKSLTCEGFKALLEGLELSSSIMHFQCSPPESLNVLEHGRTVGALIQLRAAQAQENKSALPITRLDCGSSLYIQLFFGHDVTYHDSSVTVNEEMNLIISRACDVHMVSITIRSQRHAATEDLDSGLYGLCHSLCYKNGRPATLAFPQRFKLRFAVPSGYTVHVGESLKAIGYHFPLESIYLDQILIADASTSEIQMKNFEKIKGSITFVEGLLATLRHVQYLALPTSNEGDDANQLDAAKRIGQAIASNSAMRALNVGFGNLDIKGLQYERSEIVFTQDSSLSSEQAFALMPLISCNNSLVKIELHGVPPRQILSDIGVAEVCRNLESCPNLRKLALGDWKGGNIVGNHTVDALNSANFITHLTSLDLRHCKIGPEVCLGLMNNLCGKAGQMTSLKISLNPLGDEGIRAIGNFLAHERCILNKLHVSHAEFTTEGFRSFCNSGLRYNNSLQHLVLDGNVGGIDLDILARSIEGGLLVTKIESIALVGCGIENFAPLWRIIKSPEDQVDGLPVCQSLIKLNLSENSECYLPTLLIPCLQNLTVQNCGLDNETAERICTALELRACPKLEGLDLSCNKITDDVAFRLAKVLESQTTTSALKCVCLTENKFSIECLDVITRLCPPNVILDI